MNFKKAFFLYLAAMLLLPLISGCAAFRRTFSRTPESMKRSPASPRKKTPPRRQGETGGIMQREAALYASKVQVVCPKCGKGTRVAHKIEDGKKSRICKKCGAEL